MLMIREFFIKYHSLLLWRGLGWGLMGYPLRLEVSKEYPRSAFFSGKLIFRKESIFQRIFHNETGLSIQRHLQWQGIPTVILPIRTEV
jgi:hypothetical protein